MEPKRIVVTDDDASIRRLIVFVLKQLGHLSVEATSGDEAVALIQQEQPDLVIMDVMMPGMSGFEAARVLRSDPATATIPIIFCSAGGESVLAKEADLHGGPYFAMVKPFTPKELRERVTQILGSGV